MNQEEFEQVLIPYQVLILKLKEKGILDANDFAENL